MSIQKFNESIWITARIAWLENFNKIIRGRQGENEIFSVAILSVKECVLKSYISSERCTDTQHFKLLFLTFTSARVCLRHHTISWSTVGRNPT